MVFFGSFPASVPLGDADLTEDREIDAGRLPTNVFTH